MSECSVRTSEMRRAEIRSIRDRKRLEDTPWKTLNDATNEEHLQSRREEWDADGTDHEHHAANHSLLVSNPFGDVAVDDESENASNLVSLVKPKSCEADRRISYLSSIEDDCLPSR
jgi:hypothetical protein